MNRAYKREGVEEENALGTTSPQREHPLPLPGNHQHPDHRDAAEAPHLLSTIDGEEDAAARDNNRINDTPASLDSRGSNQPTDVTSTAATTTAVVALFEDESFAHKATRDAPSGLVAKMNAKVRMEAEECAVVVKGPPVVEEPRRTVQDDDCMSPEDTIGIARTHGRRVQLVSAPLPAPTAGSTRRVIHAALVEAVPPPTMVAESPTSAAKVRTAEKEFLLPCRARAAGTGSSGAVTTNAAHPQVAALQHQHLVGSSTGAAGGGGGGLFSGPVSPASPFPPVAAALPSALKKPTSPDPTTAKNSDTTTLTGPSKVGMHRERTEDGLPMFISRQPLVSPHSRGGGGGVGVGVAAVSSSDDSGSLLSATGAGVNSHHKRRVHLCPSVPQHPHDGGRPPAVVPPANNNTEDAASVITFTGASAAAGGRRNHAVLHAADHDGPSTAVLTTTMSRASMSRIMSMSQHHPQPQQQQGSPLHTHGPLSTSLSSFVKTNSNNMRGGAGGGGSSFVAANSVGLSRAMASGISFGTAPFRTAPVVLVDPRQQHKGVRHGDGTGGPPSLPSFSGGGLGGGAVGGVGAPCTIDDDTPPSVVIIHPSLLESFETATTTATTTEGTKPTATTVARANHKKSATPNPTPTAAAMPNATHSAIMRRAATDNFSAADYSSVSNPNISSSAYFHRSYNRPVATAAAASRTSSLAAGYHRRAPAVHSLSRAHSLALLGPMLTSDVYASAANFTVDEGDDAASNPLSRTASSFVGAGGGAARRVLSPPPLSTPALSLARFGALHPTMSMHTPTSSGSNNGRHGNGKLSRAGSSFYAPAALSTEVSAVRSLVRGASVALLPQGSILRALSIRSPSQAPLSVGAQCAADSELKDDSKADREQDDIVATAAVRALVMERSNTAGPLSDLEHSPSTSSTVAAQHHATTIYCGPVAPFTQIVAVVVPTAGATLVSVAAQLITNAFVGHRLGAVPFAGFTLGISLYNVCGMSFGAGLLSALDTIIPQAVGRLGGLQDGGPDVGRALQTALLVALALVPPAMVVFWVLCPWLIAAAFEPALAADATAFLRVAPVAFAASAVASALAKTLQGINEPRLPLAAIAASTVGCLALNYFFATSIITAAACFAATLAMQAVVLALMCRLHPRVTFWRACDWPDAAARSRSALQALLSIGGPSLVAVCAEWWALEAVSAVAASVSTGTVAVVNLAMFVGCISYATAVGCSVAAAVTMGTALGRNDPAAARTAAHTSLLVAAALITIGAAVIAVTPRAVAAAFTSDAALIADFAAAAPVVALLHLLDGLQVTLQGACRGAGQQGRCAKVLLGVLWGLAVPLSAFGGHIVAATQSTTATATASTAPTAAPSSTATSPSFEGSGGIAGGSAAATAAGVLGGFVVGYAAAVALLARDVLTWDWELLAAAVAEAAFAEAHESALLDGAMVGCDMGAEMDANMDMAVVAGGVEGPPIVHADDDDRTTLTGAAA